MSQIGIYIADAFQQNTSGPFAQQDVEFMPGAFAYHLHSFSAASLRHHQPLRSGGCWPKARPSRWVVWMSRTWASRLI